MVPIFSFKDQQIDFAIQSTWEELYFPAYFNLKVVNSVVTEKYEFDYGDEPSLIKIFEALNYQDFDARLHIETIFCVFYSWSVNSSVDTFMVEIKIVLAMTYEFKIGLDLNLGEDLEITGKWSFWSLDLKSMTFWSNSLIRLWGLWLTQSWI